MAKDYKILGSKFELGHVYKAINTDSSFVYLGRCSDSVHDCLLRLSDGAVVVVTSLRYGVCVEDNEVLSSGIWWSQGNYFDDISRFNASVYSLNAADGKEKLMNMLLDIEAIRDDAEYELGLAREEGDKNSIEGLSCQLDHIDRILSVLFGKTNCADIRTDIMQNRYIRLQSVLF